MRFFLLPMLALLAMPAVATDSAASRLAQAARFDYATKLATTLALQGHIPKANFDCVAAIPLGTYTGPIAGFIGSKLNTDEIATALSFYESPVGGKYTQYGIVQFYKLKAIPEDLTVPDIDKNEMQQIVAFSRSSAGVKLMAPDFSRGMVLAAKSAEDKELVACGYKGAL
ncbi:hypothetical protein [Pseudoxanthomonas wuyuanensis]|nr:hypothetical protein [Pseudoxanthomonas wuyuanensis]